MSFLLMDIGCIECGESSTVVGVFDTEEAAQSARLAYLDPGTRWGKKGWIGQHSVEIFDLDVQVNRRSAPSCAYCGDPVEAWEGIDGTFAGGPATFHIRDCRADSLYD